MVSSKKVQFIIILILACIVLPIIASEPNEPNEPNEPKNELRISVSNNKPADSILRISYQPPYSSTCFAAVFIKGNWRDYDFKGMLETSAGKKMYYLQRDLISNQYVQDVDYGTTIGGYTYFRLYGVGTEEAKSMVEAFIEDITKKAQENIQKRKKDLIKYEEMLAKANKELLEKEPQLEEIKKQYKQAKDETHKFSSDDKAAEQAIKNTEEMDKTLNEFDIEMAGIRERINVIETYRDKPARQGGVESKLNEMYIELMIELTGLQAKKQATGRINMMERNFLNWYEKRNTLLSQINQLKNDITTWQRVVEGLSYELKNPTISMQPPQIFNNYVTIYRNVNR